MAEKADKRTRSKPNKLALKLVTIMGEMEKLQKKGRNSQQGYTFISHEQIVNELKPLLVKHKVMIIPSVLAHELQQYGNTKAGAPVTQSKVTVQYTIIDAENPTDTIVSTWAGEGTDSSDKATNKSVTASGKYYLMKLFNIAEEDPDEKGDATDHVANNYGNAPAAPQYSATNSQEVDNKPITAPQIKYLSQILIRKKIDTPERRLAVVAATMGYDPTDDTFAIKSLTSKEASTLIEDFNNTSTEALLARAKVTSTEDMPPADLPDVPFA
jgi:hypothetical protein